MASTCGSFGLPAPTPPRAGRPAHRPIIPGRAWLATLFAGILLLGSLIATPAQPAYALERRSDGHVTIPAGETIDDDLFVTGRTVRIDGRVRGDVYAFAETVFVGGVIEGDLIAAGARVDLDGTVQGDVRAAGAILQLDGAVGRNVLGAAEHLQLDDGGRIAGNLIGAASTINLAGDIGGTLTGAAENVELGGNVGGATELALRDLTIGPQARIGGRLTYHARQALDVPAGVAAGGVEFILSEHERPEATARPQQWFNRLISLFSLAWLVGSAIVGLILLRLFPRFGAEFLDTLEQQPLPSLGLGVLALLCTLPIAIVAGLTIIGLPFSLLLVAGFFAGLVTGWIFLALATGSILVGLVRKGRPWHPSWTFLFGLLVLHLGTQIPYLGALVTFVGLSFGLGTFLVAMYRTWYHGGRAPNAIGPAAGRFPAPATTAPA